MLSGLRAINSTRHPHSKAVTPRKPTKVQHAKVKLHHSPQKAKQALLAVGRCCRDCGKRLGPLEATFHCCTKALEWPFAAESVAGAWACAGTGTGSVTKCHLVSIGSCLKSNAARARFHDLWEFVRNDLSHGIDPPQLDSVAAGVSVVLLGLRGSVVVGLVWAERAATATLDNDPDHTRRARLGIALVWVRRSERRRGLATALVDAARRLAAGPGTAPVAIGEVAFSQPTLHGAAFASKYTEQAHAGQVLVYQPTWA